VSEVLVQKRGLIDITIVVIVVLDVDIHVNSQRQIKMLGLILSHSLHGIGLSLSFFKKGIEAG